jgi:hypothetical protein
MPFEFKEAVLELGRCELASWRCWMIFDGSVSRELEAR